MGDFVPGGDFIPGSDNIPSASDVLGIDPNAGNDPSQGNVGQRGTAETTTTPTDTTGSPYGSGTTTNTTGGPTDIGAPSTGTPTEPGGGGYTPDTTGLSSQAAQAANTVAKTLNSAVGNPLSQIGKLLGLPGQTTGAGAGTGTSGTTSAGNVNPASMFVNLTPGLTQGSAGNINLGGTFGATVPQFSTSVPVGYADGGATAGGDSVNESPIKHYDPLLYRGSSVLSLLPMHPNFKDLTDHLPHVQKSFAEGGHAEHVPEFYSEGGLKHRYVQGDGDGTSDSVPAMLANGEFVIPADVVSSLGNGSNDSGSKVLDEFLKTIREHKAKHEANRLPPDSKGPLAYLEISKTKVEK